MLARILTPPASERCQAQAGQHMAAAVQAPQTSTDMKEEIRGPIQKGGVHFCTFLLLLSKALRKHLVDILFTK